MCKYTCTMQVKEMAGNCDLDEWEKNLMLQWLSHSLD